MTFRTLSVEEFAGRRTAGAFVASRSHLLEKLRWNLERCVSEVATPSPTGEGAAFALIDFAHAAVALQRRVRAEYVLMLRRNRSVPYIHESGICGATTREQIYRRVAFQAALADLAELTGRGFVRNPRWGDGSIRVGLEATGEHRDLLDAFDGDPELEASFASTFIPEGKVWWMPVFTRGGDELNEWRGVTALRLNIADWQQLLAQLEIFFDPDGIY